MPSTAKSKKTTAKKSAAGAKRAVQPKRRPVAEKKSPAPSATSPLEQRTTKAARRLGLEPTAIAALGLAFVEMLDVAPKAGDKLVAVVLDGTTKDYLMRDSGRESLRGWKGSEADLLTQAAKRGRFSERAIAKEGVMFAARRRLGLAASSGERAKMNDAGEKTATGAAATKGVYGSADERLVRSYHALRLESPDKDVTPARLAGRSASSFRTATRVLADIQRGEWDDFLKDLAAGSTS